MELFKPAWKAVISLILLAATVLMTGCSTSGRDASSSQSPTTTASTETGQVDASRVSFRYTKVSPDWKVIEESNADSSYTLLEDGQGMLHLFNLESLYMYHRFLAPNGAWSQPQRILGKTMTHMGYWVGIAPGGYPCVVWYEFPDALHTMFYIDNQWRQEEPRIHDLNKAIGDRLLDFSLLDVAFDTQGEPHFFYEARYTPSNNTLSGSSYFLDDIELVQYQYEITTQDPEPVAQSLVQGIGAMCDSSGNPLLHESIHFYIDSANVYHLMYCDESSKTPEGSSTAYTAYHHSNSRDGGKTWEGPFVLFENGFVKYESGDIYNDIENVSVFEDSNGRLRIAVLYDNRAQPRLLVVTLSPDSFEVESTEGHFGDEQTTEALGQLPIDEKSVYYGMEFQTVIADATGEPHFITNGVDAQYWDISQIEGNAWALRDIKKPLDNCGLVAAYLRSNGSLALLSKEYDKQLFYAEIPPE